MAARIPTIATTTISSIKVNPQDFFIGSPSARYTSPGHASSCYRIAFGAGPSVDRFPAFIAISIENAWLGGIGWMKMTASLGCRRPE